MPRSLKFGLWADRLTDLLMEWTFQGGTEGDFNINVLKTDGFTVLTYAAQSGHLDRIEYLIENEADANIANFDGSKPIHRAARFGHKNIVEFFYNLGVSVDCCDFINYTPIHYAAEYGKNKVVQFLIDIEADIDAKNSDGNTPLLLAASNMRKGVVEMLIKSGADVEYCNERDKFTLLHYASRNGWREIVQSFISKKRDLNIRTTDGDTPILCASGKNIIDLLIDSGADVHVCNLENRTVLHHAAKHGWLDLVQRLVKMKCDVNVRLWDGNTPLLLAAQNNSREVVDFLIKSGANVECRCLDNGSLIHYAAENGWLDIVQSFVDKKCDINLKTTKGDTPLLFAAKFRRNRDVIEFLFESGADIDVCNDEKLTLLHYASQYGWLEIVLSILVNSRKWDPNAKTTLADTPLLLAARYRNRDIVELLLYLKVDVTGHDVKNCTVLHYASRNAWVQVVKTLIERGSEINTVNADGETPLHLACLNLQIQIVKDLLEAGADLKAKFKDYTTVLSFVLKEAFNAELIGMLIKYGAYFEDIDVTEISSRYKDRFLKDIKLCSQAIINRFSNKDLPLLHDADTWKKFPDFLPLISPFKLEIKNNIYVAREIEKRVKREIETEGYCDLKEACATYMPEILSCKLLDVFYVSQRKKALIDRLDQICNKNKRRRLK